MYSNILLKKSSYDLKDIKVIDKILVNLSKDD